MRKSPALLGLHRHAGELVVISDIVDHLGSDELVFGIDDALRVVADDSALTRGYAPRIGIGETDLFVTTLFKLRGHLPMFFRLRLKRGDLV